MVRPPFCTHSIAENGAARKSSAAKRPPQAPKMQLRRTRRVLPTCAAQKLAMVHFINFRIMRKFFSV